MSSQFGRKPTGWSQNYWKKVKNPEAKTLISSQSLITRLLENKSKLIAIGGWAANYHKLKNEINDYDFIISTEPENLKLIYNILIDCYFLNFKIFESNVVNITKLKTLDKKVDLIKIICGNPTNANQKKGVGFYSLKNFNYSNLIENAISTTIFGLPIEVMSEKDYVDSQHGKLF